MEEETKNIHSIISKSQYEYLRKQAYLNNSTISEELRKVIKKYMEESEPNE